MARAPVSKTGGCRFEVLPLLPAASPKPLRRPRIPPARMGRVTLFSDTYLHVQPIPQSISSMLAGCKRFINQDSAA